MMTHRRTSRMAMAVLLCCAVHAHAVPVLVSDGSVAGNRDNFTGTVGTRFTVGASNLVIDALGYEDPGGNGLVTSHQVGIWRVGDQQLLASVTVPAGSSATFDDTWRYVNIGSYVTLGAGETYAVGARVTSGSGDAWTDITPVDFALGAGVVDANPTNNFVPGGFGFPGNDGTLTDLRWAPANATLLNAPVSMSINVPNFSFENPVTGGAIAEIDDWTDPSGCCDGVFVSPGFGQGAAPTDGNQIAFMNADSGQIFQTLTDTFMTGADYALSVDVSGRSAPGTDTMLMVLYEGAILGLGDLNPGNTVASRILGANTGVVGDEFRTFTLSVSRDAILAASATGQPIGIGFFGLNSGSGTSDFDLDNVRLTKLTAAVPEPASMTLLVVGAAGLLRRRRRA